MVLGFNVAVILSIYNEILYYSPLSVLPEKYCLPLTPLQLQITHLYEHHLSDSRNNVQPLPEMK